MTPYSGSPTDALDGSLVVASPESVAETELAFVEPPLVVELSIGSASSFRPTHAASIKPRNMTVPPIGAVR
jgi:hypothetical protein